MEPVGTIEEELAMCIKAWESCPEAKWAWCCHHGWLREPLIEPWMNRVQYIINTKPVGERAIRLRNFRPIRILLQKMRELDMADAECKESQNNFYEISRSNSFWHMFPWTKSYKSYWKKWEDAWDKRRDDCLKYIKIESECTDRKSTRLNSSHL